MATQINNQEQLAQWVKEQFQRANKHLAQKGILFDSVTTQDSRYLAPHVAVWKIKDTKGKYYWVISGDLPADAVSADAANNVRDAIRHFSMLWQIKAQNIFQSNSTDKVQTEFADLLVSKAEMLYKFHENEALWQEQT